MEKGHVRTWANPPPKIFSDFFLKSEVREEERKGWGNGRKLTLLPISLTLFQEWVRFFERGLTFFEKGSDFFGGGGGVESFSRGG